MKTKKIIIALLAIIFQGICNSTLALVDNSNGAESASLFKISNSGVFLNNFNKNIYFREKIAVNTFSQQIAPPSNPTTSVSSIYPQLGAFNVDSSVIVKVTFNNPVITNTINNSSLIIAGEVSGVHTGTFLFSENNTVIKYLPDSPFKKGEKVQVNISSKIKDINNANIAAFTSQFTIITNQMPDKFTSVKAYNVGERPVCVVVNDVNRDGFGDIITANSSYQGTGTSKTISILTNDGNGNFPLKTDYVTDTLSQVEPFDISVGDVDGDGFGDIAAANFYAKSISVLKNDGNGNFSFPKIYRIAGHPMKSKLYDIDGDGDLDIVVTCGGINWYSDATSKYVYVLKNNGDGTFASPITYNVGYGQYGLDIFDLNGDGFGDIVVAIPKQNKICVLFNNGDGTFGTLTNYASGVSNPQRVFIADIDGDGDGDIVITNQSSYSVMVFKNNGHGVFSGKNYSTQGQPVGLFISDIDGDGDQDIIAANNNVGCNTFTIWKNRADGVFNQREDFYVPPGKQPIDIYVADIDNDGDVDIIVANWMGNSVTVMKNAIPGINGNVFEDTNGNGIRDSSEYGLADRVILLDGNGIQTQYATTNSDGDYYFVVAPGTYTLKLKPEEGWIKTYPINDYTIDVPENNKEVKNINFGSKFILTNGTDLGVSIQGIQLPDSSNCFSGLTDYCNGVCSKCVQNNYTVNYFNNGSMISDPCTLIVHLPTGEMYDSSQVSGILCPPDNISGSIADGFVFEWYHLCDNPGQNPCPSIKQHSIQPKSLNIITHTACCTPVGTILHSYADILPDDGNNNNHSEYDMAYSGPIFPNVKKLVFPEGNGPCKTISAADSLTYEIYFQNVGTAPANYIQVVDTLDYLNLDVSSLKILLTSHPATFNISGAGILTWTFRNIHLPDSSTDQQGSIGYIKYRIKPRSGISGKVIKNRATIYLESIPPVFTNYVTSTIAGDTTAIAKFEAKQPDFCGQPLVYDFNYIGNLPSGTFEWNFGAETTPSTSLVMNPQGIKFNAPGQKIITLKVTTPYGCISSFTDTIMVNQSSAITGITPSGATTFCSGDSVILTANPDNSIYNWSTGATTQSITVSTSGKYDVYGCSGSHAFIIVTVNPIPAPEIVTEKNPAICQGDSV
ncbi:MAG: FG-GAP-like repeat-containing protein, partial [Bacteroidales bacterium]